MTNHEITGKQAESILILFWFGSSVISAVSPEAKQDSWISILIATLAALPLIALYVRLNRLYPGLNFYEVLFKIFGNIMGRVIALIYIFYFIHLASLAMRVLTQFVHVLSMEETPEFLIGAFIVVIGAWAAKNGPEAIGRVSKFIVPIVLISALFTFVIGIKDMNFSYMKPFLEADFKSLLAGAFGYFTLPLGEMVTCFSFLAYINTRTSTPKIYLKALFYFSAIVLVATYRNILVLGVPTALLYYFSSYQAVSILSLGEFFTRIEVLIGMNLMLGGFIKVTVCLYSASLGIAKVFKIQDQKSIIIPTGLLILTVTDNAFRNVPEQFAWVKMYQLYAVPFEIIFPLIIWAAAEIQAKIKQQTSGAEAVQNVNNQTR